MVWQIKASTLCNLRCRYCYEWDRLADRRRLTLPQWRRILQAAADYRALCERDGQQAVGTHVILHGGEPLLSPLPYLEDVFALEHEILGGNVQRGIQTNLTRLSDALLAWLRQEDVLLGVSWDGDDVARLDRGDRPTSDRVRDNLQRLRAAGIRFGIVLVLAAHNHRRLPELYDQVETLGAAWLNVVPMFQSTTPAAAGALSLPPEATLSALAALFEHWVARGRRLPVHPVLRALRVVHDRQAGRRRPPGDGARFIVQPDGRLSLQGGTASPDVAVGNLFDQTIGEIVESAAYAAALARADRLRRRHCSACRYEGACDARPVLEQPHSYPAGACPLESRLCDHIDSFLRSCESTAAELLGWTDAVLPAALEHSTHTGRPLH